MNRQGGATVNRKHAEIINAVDMIGMRVSQEHSINIRDFSRQQLKTKLGWRINKQRTRVALEK
jgi:hypothetical protein